VVKASGRPSVDCLLLLGGNVGGRRKHLQNALAGLSHLPGSKVLARSRIYETAPVGPSLRPYLNMAAKLRTRLTPMGLLAECKRLEALAGRRPGLRWGPRPLDIDILSYGRARIKTPWLVVPHPRISERAFVLAPLAELAPHWKPSQKGMVASLLKRLNPGPGTVNIFSHA